VSIIGGSVVDIQTGFDIGRATVKRGRNAIDEP
jgi:hypothetical protein